MRCPVVDGPSLPTPSNALCSSESFEHKPLCAFGIWIHLISSLGEKLYDGCLLNWRLKHTEVNESVFGSSAQAITSLRHLKKYLHSQSPFPLSFRFHFSKFTPASCPKCAFIFVVPGA